MISKSKVQDDNRNWWLHMSPDGNEIWCAKQEIPMAELDEMDRLAAECSEDSEQDDDPDADGYGWERKALAGVYNEAF